MHRSAAAYHDKPNDWRHTTNVALLVLITIILVSHLVIGCFLRAVIDPLYTRGYPKIDSLKDAYE